MSKLAKEILLKNGNPPIVEFFRRPKTLFELLNVQKLRAYKYKVQPVHWYEKGFEGCYYEVHRTKYTIFNNEPKHGHAWALLFWRGRPAFHPPKEMKGGTKFAWQQYRSPAADGIKYDQSTAKTIEKRRNFLLKGYYTGLNPKAPPPKDGTLQ